jgi:helix-turn-helix protein
VAPAQGRDPGHLPALQISPLEPSTTYPEGAIMTTDDAGQVLGISDKSVARLCSQGRLPGSVKVRRPGTKRGKVWKVDGKSVRRRKAERAK